MIGFDGRKQLPNERQRPSVATPRLATTGGITPHHQGLAAFAEIARIARLFRDRPQADQANPVRMQQAAEALLIRSPTQVGRRINSSFGRLAKDIGPAEWQYATQDAAQCDLVDR